MGYRMCERYQTKHRRSKTEYLQHGWLCKLLRWCKKLDWFLDTFRSNFNSHGHVFSPGGPDLVKYAISLLDAWSTHQNPTHRQTAMTDPSEWVGDLSVESDPCLPDLDLLSHKMAKVYGDMNRRCVAVITVMQQYIQLPQESVRVYVNSLKANWRQAGWNLQKHEEVLYHIAWAGLRNSLKNKVGLMTTACSRFDTLDHFFNTATASEVTHVWKYEATAPATTAPTITATEIAYEQVFQRRQKRLPAIHLWASQHHRWEHIQPTGIKQKCQVRWRRTIVRLATSTMGLNRNFQKPMFCRQVFRMRISERQHELLPYIPHEEVSHHSSTRH